jgi:hypothetical protein
LAITATSRSSSATIGTKVTTTPLASGAALFETTTATVVYATATTIITGASVCRRFRATRLDNDGFASNIVRVGGSGSLIAGNGSKLNECTVLGPLLVFHL